MYGVCKGTGPDSSVAIEILYAAFKSNENLVTREIYFRQ